MIAPKIIKLAHEFIANDIDPLLREMDIELAQDREMEVAFREAKRADNMIKFKDVIKGRPKSEWIHNKE